MRSKIIVFSIVLFMAGIVWWFKPDQIEVAQGAAGGRIKPIHAQSFSSVTVAPDEAVVVKPAVAAAPPQAAFVKSVGAHPGPAVPFKHKDKIASADAGSEKTPFDRYARLKLGPGMQIAGKTRRAIAARAVPEGQDASSVGPVAFKDKGFTIASTDGRDPNFQNLVYSANAKPVVMNPSNGRLGIVTGTMIVAVTDSGAADRIAGQEGFQLLDYQANTKLAFFKVPEGYELVPGVARVSKSQGVTHAEIEILEGFKEAK